MRTRIHHASTVVPLVLMIGLLGACTGSPASSAGPTPPPQETPTTAPATPPPATPVPATGEVPPAVMDAARAGLARSVGADAAAAATVVTAEAVDWPDSSLGCPQPDMMYLQVITPGYRVVLEVDGTQYDMRATTAGGVLLCEPGLAPGG